MGHDHQLDAVSRTSFVLDTVLVRTLLVPALVAIMGRWNWWMPGRAARLLGVRPDPSPAGRASV